MSTLTQTLIQEIQNAPETVQQELFDFLAFLKARQMAQTIGWRPPTSPVCGARWGG